MRINERGLNTHPYNVLEWIKDLMILWCGDIDTKKIISKDINEQILRCTSNYEASKISPLFFEINSLDVHLSNIKLWWIKLKMFNSSWQISHDILPHG